MSSQGGFMGNGDSQPAQSAIRQRSYRTITIRQALSATEDYPDSPTIVDQKPIDHACICAIVRETQHSNSGISYRLQDSTGSFEARKFTPAGGNEGFGFDEKPEEEVVLGQYVLVHGHFRNFRGRRTFNIIRVDPKVAPLQILYHEIEALREYLHNTGKLPFGTSEKPHEANGNSHSNGQDLFVSEANPLRQRLQRILDDNVDSEDGVSLEYLSKETGNPEAVIERELMNMCNDHLVYEMDEGQWSSARDFDPEDRK